MGQPIATAASTYTFSLMAITALLTSLGIPPQLGSGGGMPKPRKLRAASVRITPGTVVEKRIIMGAIILGRMCRVSILRVGQPIATAASTYTFSLMAITALLTSLEPVIPYHNPITMINPGIPRPTRDIMTIRIGSQGMHIQASTNLCTIRSNLPPMYPHRIPIIVERSVARAVAAKPTITEIRAPRMTRLSRSRPR
ncbi:hypothetical protein ES703_98011 [subsurface metagenome]